VRSLTQSALLRATSKSLASPSHKKVTSESSLA